MNRRNYIIATIVLLVIIVWIVAPQKESVDVQEEIQVDTTANKLHAQAEILIEDRKLSEAKGAFVSILSDYPDYELVENIQTQLEDVNMEIVLSNAAAPEVVVHKVVSGDTLGKLASKYGTTIDLIKIRNNLKSNVIRINQRLSIWTGTFDILVDKSQNILLLKSNGEVVKTYDVATGENNSTPIGECVIDSKLKDPVWFKQGGVVVPPESPANELGSRWLGFDAFEGYGIHGTVKPESIGRQATMGCVRMRNEEVEELFSLVPYGTKVKIID